MTCRITQDALRRYVQYAWSGRVVVFDTETTGISSDDEIIQFAAAEYVNGELCRTLNLYAIPTCLIHPEAEAVHHITMQYLNEHGISPTEALERFFEFLGSNALVVAHNIHFDFRMLQNECRKFEYEACLDNLFFCDTIAMAKRIVPGLEHYRLGCLVDALGLKGSNTHNALDDTLACGELFFNLIKRLPFFPDDYVYEPIRED